MGVLPPVTGRSGALKEPPRQCKFPGRDSKVCQLTMLGRGPGAFCALHDRIACKCGHRLIDGREKLCPKCGFDVRLSNRLT